MLDLRRSKRARTSGVKQNYPNATTCVLLGARQIAFAALAVRVLAVDSRIESENRGSFKMKLPKFTKRAICERPIVAHAHRSLEGITESQASIPAAIAGKLASEYAISTVDGLAQCVGTLAGILDNYQRCVDGGSNVQCANIAARHIATIACRSYCHCS